MPSPLIPLTGIARLASEGSLLAEKRRVEYRSLPTRKWLNRCHSKRVPFDWTLNPYRGCEYGCKYCYARFTHEFLELPEENSFETEIYAKDWSADSFRQELKALKPGQVIGLGTATDPYQPAERKFGRTRTLLEALDRIAGQSIFVTTKSDLVARDADLFAELSRRNHVCITLSVTTLSSELASLTEPFAPRPELRLRAAEKLAQAGVRTTVIASPVLPLLTDSEGSLQAVASAARNAGARGFGANVLFLKPCAQNSFFPFLARHFPQYEASYRQNYGSSGFLRGEYPARIRERVARIRERTGLSARDFETPPPLASALDAQLLLF